MSHLRAFVLNLFVAFLLVGCAALSSPAPASSPKLDPVWGDVSYTHHAPEWGVNALRIPVWIDADFSPRDRADIKAAVDGWNTALNGHRVYFVADDNAKGLTEAGSPIQQIVEHDGLGLLFVAIPHFDVPTNVLGWVDELGDNVVHLDRAENNGTRQLIVALHEMGHTMGLDHVRTPYGLMGTVYTSQPPCVDETSVQILAALHGWDYRTMNWCSPARSASQT